MKQPYSAPKLTVVTFRVEQGFVGSMQESQRLLDFDFYVFNDESDYNQAASYHETDWTW
ncbi:MAG: hypothetical protein J6031_02170 [Bacteroidales bacterium]|nr:hypothetical protein [Bacteroidales bacterium]